MKKHVLIIDDNAVERFGVSQAFARAGYETEVREYPLGSSAWIMRWQNDHPGEVLTIICDLNMPALQGDDLCRNLRKNPITKNCCIVLFSGHHLEDREGEGELIKGLETLARECGADGAMKKSSDLAGLVRVVESLHRRKTK